MKKGQFGGPSARLSTKRQRERKSKRETGKCKELERKGGRERERKRQIDLTLER